MLIFPAIDLYEGKAVRLLRGDYNNMTVYSDDPAAFARDFAERGATHVHLVDLEGARTGQTPNLNVIARLVKESRLFAEVGGGIRDLETIEKYIDVGVSRVILGTAAVTSPDLLDRALARYKDKIAVGVDVKDGFVAIHGWTKQSDRKADDFCRELESRGVSNVVCTDISKDGALQGAGFALYESLPQSVRARMTASGGVTSVEDIERLKALGLYGAIIGKAYYTGRIGLEEAMEAAR